MNDQRHRPRHPQNPNQSQPPPADLDALAKQLELLTERITQAPGAMQAVPFQQPPPRQPTSPDIYDKIADDFRPANKVITAMKWVLGITIPIFMAGGAYYKFENDVAMKSDIEDHITNDLNPVREKVGTIEHGVNTLLDQKQKEREIKKVERRLLRHQTKFLQLMADYRSARARGQWMRKPTESNELLNLESALEDLLDAPISVPIRVITSIPDETRRSKKGK